MEKSNSNYPRGCNSNVNGSMWGFFQIKRNPHHHNRRRETGHQMMMVPGFYGTELQNEHSDEVIRNMKITQESV